MVSHVVRAVLAIVAVSTLAVSADAQRASPLKPSVDEVQVSPSHSIRVARYANEPLRVTGITNSFDDERWLDRLSIVVENVSDRPVSIAKYYLRFSARSASDEIPGLRFWFVDPARVRGAAASAMLQPGKRTTLQVLRGEELQSPASAFFPRDVVPLLEPIWVGFGDGSRWDQGLLGTH